MVEILMGILMILILSQKTDSAFGHTEPGGAFRLSI